MMFRYLSVILIFAVVLLMHSWLDDPSGKAAPPGWPEIGLLPIGEGLEAPVHLTHAGDGRERIFIVEQAGRIRILQNGKLSDIFLDITDRVRSPFNGGGNEEGLLSLAFPPSFGDLVNHFYVYYTRKDGNNWENYCGSMSNQAAFHTQSRRIIPSLAFPDIDLRSGRRDCGIPGGFRSTD